MQERGWLMNRRSFLVTSCLLTFLALLMASGWWLFSAEERSWQEIQRFFEPAVLATPGLRQLIYDNPDLAGQPLSQTLVDCIDLRLVRPLFSEGQSYSIRYSGFLKIETAGRYRLASISQDGSRIFMDGEELVHNWGRHSRREFSAEIFLAAGYHFLDVSYFSSGDFADLDVFLKYPGGRREALPAKALFPARPDFDIASLRPVIRNYLAFQANQPLYLAGLLVAMLLLVGLLIGCFIFGCWPNQTRVYWEKHRSGLLQWGLVSMLLGGFFLETFGSMRQKSATFDEPVNVSAGYYYLKTGVYCEDPTHPPFLRLWAALPLLWLNPERPQPAELTVAPENPLPPGLIDQSLVTRYLFFKNNDSDRLLWYSRTPVIFLGMMLGGMVFLFARKLAGPGGGILALLFYIFCPNILAHSQLVTTDLAITLFIFCSVYAFYLLTCRITMKRILLLGIFLGLAFTTKLSSLILLPCLALLGILAIYKQPRLPASPVVNRLIAPLRRIGFGRNVPRVRNSLRSFVLLALAMFLALVVADIIIWETYDFRFEQTCYDGMNPASLLQVHLNAEGGDPVERGRIIRLVQFLLDWKVFPAGYIYGLGIIEAMLRAEGLIAYFAGQYSITGWWYYGISAFALKTPLPTCLLLLLGLLGLLFKRLWQRQQIPMGTLSVVLPILFFFAFACFNKLNIGVRYLLPVYPFIYVFLGLGWRFLADPNRWIRWSFSLLLIWAMLTSLLIYPHYLAYFSDAIGGASQGYKYLADSNIDWGQDLKGLKKYLDAHGIERIKLSYFGAAIPQYYKIPMDYLHSYVIMEPENMGESFNSGDYVAISVTNWQHVHIDWLDRFEPYFRAGLQPIDQIGYSMFIFRIP
jgi:hypothetical protein